MPDHALRASLVDIVRRTLAVDPTIDRNLVDAIATAIERDQPPRTWITEAEAAKLLSIDPASLLRWRKSGAWHGEPFAFTLFTIGRAIRYDQAEILAYIDHHTETPK